jgi:hypothetical protein
MLNELDKANIRAVLDPKFDTRVQTINNMIAYSSEVLPAIVMDEQTQIGKIRACDILSIITGYSNLLLYVNHLTGGNHAAIFDGQPS